MIRYMLMGEAPSELGLPASHPPATVIPFNQLFASSGYSLGRSIPGC